MDNNQNNDPNNININLNEMIAAGVRKFACGLGKAMSLRTQPNGEVLVTDGPYLEAKEHVGGLLILETADLDEALGWKDDQAVLGIRPQPRLETRAQRRPRRFHEWPMPGVLCQSGHQP